MKHNEQIAVVCAILASVAMTAGSVFAQAQTMPRQEWSRQVAPASQNPDSITGTMAKLSDADQLAFLKAVNEAIEKMPGSADQKSALHVKAARAALVGASKGNKTAMLAEIYATVPVASLAVVNEDLAKTAVARGTTSDEEFAGKARGTMTKIIARTATADNSDVRATFAILMFVRASGGTPAGLSDELAAKLSPANQGLAKSSWIPTAMAGGDHRYDPMLGAASAGEMPDFLTVGNLLLSGPAITDAMLGDLQADSSEGMRVSADNIGGGAFANPSSNPTVGLSFGDSGLSRVPRSSINLTEPRGYNGQR